MGQVFKSFSKTKKAPGLKDKSSKKAAAPAKLKKKITPGSVLILLAGRFRGSRVVFLKQLEGGALLVTGPYAVNGVPLRRVNQRFCIATSTKVDASKAKADSVKDAFFAREKKSGKKADMFAADAVKTDRSDAQKAEQKKIDESIVKGLSADQKAYLKARFSLSGNMYPHELKF